MGGPVPMLTQSRDLLGSHPLRGTMIGWQGFSSPAGHFDWLAGPGSLSPGTRGCLLSWLRLEEGSAEFAPCLGEKSRRSGKHPSRKGRDPRGRAGAARQSRPDPLACRDRHAGICSYRRSHRPQSDRLHPSRQLWGGRTEPGCDLPKPSDLPQCRGPDGLPSPAARGSQGSRTQLSRLVPC